MLSLAFAAQRQIRQADSFDVESRALWTAIALSPLAVTVISFFSDWRFFDGRASWLGVLCYVVAGLIAAVNFHLSFVREPLHRWRTGSAENFRFISGVPLLGDVAVVGLLFLPPSIFTSAATILLMLLNTGSMLWFAVAVLREPPGSAAAYTRNLLR